MGASNVVPRFQQRFRLEYVVRDFEITEFWNVCHLHVKVDALDVEQELQKQSGLLAD